MTSNLPLDRISKVLFFGGIALIIYSFLTHQTIVESYPRTFESRMEKFKNLSKEILDSESDEERTSLVKEAEMNEAMIKIEKGAFDSKIKINWLIFIMGVVNLSGGVFLWVMEELLVNRKNLIESHKINLQYIDCQSCSTQLQLIEINNGNIYCTNCHDGNKFLHPNLKFETMARFVRIKMRRSGCSEINIKNQITRLGRLYRWNKTFKW